MLRLVSSTLQRLSNETNGVGQPSMSVQPAETSRQAFLTDVRHLVCALREKVEKDRTNVDDYILIGRLFRLQGESRRAYRLHNNLLARPFLEKHQQARLYRELGMDVLSLRAQDFGEASFLKSLELEKNNEEALLGLVQCYELTHNLEEASGHLIKLSRFCPSQQTHLSFVMAGLAAKHLAQERVAPARRVIARSLKADPECPYALIVLSDVFVAAQRFERAISILRSFLMKWPPLSFLVLRRLEDVYFRMNKFPVFEETLRDCIHVAPENFYLHYSLARHLRKKRKTQEALQHLYRALECNPLYVNAFRDLLQFSPEFQQAQQAVSAANRFFELYKKSRRFICPNCRQRYTSMTWYCTTCGTWAVFEIRYELLAP